MISEETYWKLRVLEKLRHIILSGSLTNVVKWQYDSEDSIMVENKNLMVLHTLGIIDVSKLDNNAPDAFYKNDDDIYISDNNTDIVAYDINTPDGEAIIHNLNPASYEALCKELGLNPHQETYIASLELAGIGKPIITVGGRRYPFPSLHSESYKEKLLTLLFKHPNKTLTMGDFRKEPGFSSVNNLNELVENSYLSKELSPFIHITKSSVSLTPEAHLSKEELALIKNYKTKKS
jgi:hypothetical protein